MFPELSLLRFLRLYLGHEWVPPPNTGPNGFYVALLRARSGNCPRCPLELAVVI